MESNRRNFLIALGTAPLAAEAQTPPAGGKPVGVGLIGAGDAVPGTPKSRSS